MKKKHSTPNNGEQLGLNESVEHVTITHPFHPWKGERLQLLSGPNRRDALRVKRSTGDVVIIPRDWTDRADPNPYRTLSDSQSLLSFPHLLQLAELLEEIEQATRKKESD